jgi:glycosyltransferase involved in cell wall biosynthesis
MSIHKGLKSSVQKSLLFQRRVNIIREARKKITLGHKVLMMRRFENAEVSRLAGELERIPQAKVATVVATYRRPELLYRAVRSALEQSVRDHVVLVVDDAGGLLELPDDPRLFSVSLASNTAIAGVVRNVGIRLSRSKYVAFLDDDNEWEANHLEAALAAFEGAPAGQQPSVIYTAVQTVLPDGSLQEVLSTPFDRKLLRRLNYVDTSCLVVRRFHGLHFSRLYRARGKYPKEDWELVYRLSRRLRVAHVPVQSVRYLINPDSYSR